jgi:ABC-type lipopolysaccharide export system ATPase subunit
VISPKELVVEQAEKIHQELKQSLQKVKSVALSEVWKILQLVTANVIQIIETVANNLSGSEKKAIAIEYINSFYDKVFLVIDIPLVPSLIEPIIHRYIKQILMILVSSSIDAMVTIFRQTGVFLKKGTE